MLRKNIRPLGGVPLIAHSIRAALGSKQISRVLVSTDDSEIAACAQRFGAEVVRRPDDLSGDTATSESALVHCLDVLADKEDYKPDLVMMIQCTSPLTTSQDLDGLVDHLKTQKADSAFTAVPFYHFVWEHGASGQAQGINHEGKKRKRRQDLKPQFLENGAAYVMRTDAFRESQERFCGKVVMHEVAEVHALEIDEPVDFLQAEVLMAEQQQQVRALLLPHSLEAIVFDFDGVFTDDRVLVMDDGHEAVLCSRSDGMGLEQLRTRGIALLILSKERNLVVTKRAEKLRIECQQAMDDKLTFLENWLGERSIDAADVVYVGNDINDVECMKLVGCGVVPADAHPRAAAHAQIVLEHCGGRGAVRELCDLILSGASK